MRLGLLSTARINDAILKGAQGTDRVEVVAVGSRDSAKAQAYASEHGLERAHGSYEALLENPEIDAVYISLPNSLHHSWTMHALAAGKHVLCEKPYSRRPAEVEEAFDAADAAGLVLAEAFMYRHNPQTAVARELVETGRIGRLRAINATFSFPLADQANVRLISDLDGGALMDVGCYCISGSRLLAGEPERVLGEQAVSESGVDVAFHGTLRFPNEVIAQFHASFVAPNRQRLEAIGEDGMLVLETPFRVDEPGVTLRRSDGDVAIDVPLKDSYTLELEDFAAAVAGERKPLLGRADALAQARTIDALYRSAESGEAVTL
ncbi:MAG: D-xylose 1-dehydrogenase D-xylono,5-lactone-forming [Gaiellaceae bacterium]|nr:D-xylose 1-dehydrogenase D-xylono,5-lactone-forming [Gaiellaceae bacterium]